MDQSEVALFMQEHVPRIALLLELHGWEFQIRYGATDGGARMQVVSHPRYGTATIFVDPHLVEDELQLHTDLVHELLHCVTSYYDDYRDSVLPFITEGPARKSEAKTFRNCDERAVVHLTRLLAPLLRIKPEPVTRSHRRKPVIEA